jgi:ADP-ribosylglycohydrolase
VGGTSLEEALISASHNLPRDFETSILLAVNGGYDTDCTAASVGASLGLLLGKQGIPARWIEPSGAKLFQ